MSTDVKTGLESDLKSNGKSKVPTETDEALMLAYAGGENRAFDLLYRRYESKLYGFLFMRLTQKREEVASELFQVVWLKIHQAKHRYDSSKKFSSWFFTIAINTIRDFFSTSSNKYETLVADDPPGEGQDLSRGPEALVIQKEKFQEITALIQKLPPARREAILLCDLEGFSVKEAAEILNCSEDSVRQLLSRARRDLRTSLDMQEIKQ